jgi:hypothetical protein
MAQLDAGRATTDDRESQHLASHRGRLGICRLLESEQQPAANFGRIVDLLQARREPSPFIVPKVAVLRAARHHEVVVGNAEVAHDALD